MPVYVSQTKLNRDKASWQSSKYDFALPTPCIITYPGWTYRHVGVITSDFCAASWHGRVSLLRSWYGYMVTRLGDSWWSTCLPTGYGDERQMLACSLTRVSGPADVPECSVISTTSAEVSEECSLILGSTAHQASFQIKWHSLGSGASWAEMDVSAHYLSGDFQFQHRIIHPPPSQSRQGKWVL